MGESNADSIGTNFMPHIINVKATKDITMPPDFSRDISSPDGHVVKEGVAGILVAASPMQFGVNSWVLPSNQLELKPKKLKNGSGRPREFMSLYLEGAENIKGVLQQNVKKKEEERKHELEEHGVMFTKPELKQNEKEKEDQGVIFAWFRKRKEQREEAERVYGNIIPSPFADHRLFVLKQPVGVVGAIVPRNLPLAHILDRTIEEYFFHKGASIGYYHGDLNALRDNMMELKPTLLAGVRRVFEKV
jgi:hypothetical protein